MRKKLVRAMLACSLVSVAMVGLAARADAAFGPINCTAGGTVQVADDPITGIAAWEIKGGGSCLGDGNGTYLLAFTGTGTSVGLGSCGTSGTVQNLRIPVTLTLTNTVTNAPRVIAQVWQAQATTYPVSVPYQIGANNGGGVMHTRIFSECPPAGSPTAYFEFTFG
jgi:hypothetical protein